MGWAVSLDGVDDCIQLGTLGDFGSQLNKSKIEITFKTPQGYIGKGFLFGVSTTGYSSAQSAIYRVGLNTNEQPAQSPGKTEIYLRSGTGQIIAGAINSPILYDGDYHTLLLDSTAISSGIIRVYVDGVQQTIIYRLQLQITNHINLDHNLFVGAFSYQGSPEPPYAPITVQKIKFTINDQPHAEYPIDEGQGNIIHDISGNDFHGEIVGGVWVYFGEVKTASARFQIGFSLKARNPQRIQTARARLQIASETHAHAQKTAQAGARFQSASKMRGNGLVLFVPEGVFVIDADEIFSKNQPSRGQVVANYIEVWVNPLKPVTTAEEVYRSKDPITVPAGTTKTITAHFNEEPVTEPVATLEEAGANLSIADTKYYAWGADVKIQNAGSGAQTCRIKVNGKPLKVQGREKIVKEDPVSIQENGLKKYTFDNPFVQDRATAELIADKLLSYANVKRDIEIDWRGDPAVELADVTMIPEYQRRGLDQRGIFYITKQELEFDGGLQAKLEGRKM